MTSLSDQSKKLLRDKKALLIQNKLLTDRIAEVREEERQGWVVQLDALKLQLSDGKGITMQCDDYRQ